MKSVPVCEECNEPILRPDDGFIIQGNIYTADAEAHNGIIGNCFPDPDESGNIPVDGIHKVAFCRDCLVQILGR